jgi:hypothetical protein
MRRPDHRSHLSYHWILKKRRQITHESIFIPDCLFKEAGMSLSTVMVKAAEKFIGLFLGLP